MVPHSRFFALYDRPFWRESGLSGTAQSGVGPLVEIHEATLAFGSAGLFGFVGLDRRQRIVAGEEALVSAAIAQLVRLFGPMAGQPRETLLKDWAADVFTATDTKQVPAIQVTSPVLWMLPSGSPAVCLRHLTAW